MTIDRAALHQPLHGRARPSPRCRGRGSTSPRRARAPPGRPARPGPATPAAARPPTAASPARAPRCRARRASAAKRSQHADGVERGVDLGVGRVGAGRCGRCRGSCRRTGSPPGARRRCARAASASVASRRSTPPKRDACPRSGRRGGRSAWPASTCRRRSGRRARAARPAAIVERRRRAAPARSAGVGERRRRRPRCRPRPGRSTAPGRSGTSAVVSSRPNSLLRRGAGRLHGVEQLAELLDRLEQVGQQQHERGDGADRDTSPWWTSQPPMPTTAAVVADARRTRRPGSTTPRCAPTRMCAS